jgi:SAM-dependent methyltransferase
MESGNPDMVAYGRGFIQGLPRYLPQLREESRMISGPDDQVLDIGCGFGWHAMLLSLLTGAQVTANDVRATMTSVVEARCEALSQQGVPVRVRVLLGDACSLDLAPGSFDVITCLQTMEHVRDPEAAVWRMSRLLAPGGRILITNTNNARSRAVVRENLRLWRQRDRSPQYIEQIKRERPIENADIEPYALMRRRIIMTEAPHLAAADVDALEAATAGQDRAEILASIERFERDGSLPTPPRLGWCRNPLTGEYCERLLDPHELVRMLQMVGIAARLEHRFTRWPLRLFNRVRLRPLNDLLFQLRPTFAVMGEQRSRRALRIHQEHRESAASRRDAGALVR